MRQFVSGMAAVVATVCCGAAPPIEDSRLADIGPAPETVLIDARSGEPFSLAEVRSRGKVALVSFIYTTCNGSCPATTHTMYRVQEALKRDRLWGDHVEFVSITLDPKTDRPEVLSRYADLYDADPKAWHFLTGEPEDVSRVISSWDMWARIGPSGTLDHPSRIFLVDPKGRQREIYNLQFLNPEGVVADVRAVLDESAAPSR
ncbi:SCO family protein [Tautonia sociabilis]|uniref:SCO family protein n=1 Tax=Tautonia sociabilis TaxID=2080755 RepID=A0A432MNI7_9BACT|nr:SCO family protein [Tautonia sociabilis]RUL88880.1 SCO family protein [Tautonia sociabilis]